MTVTELASRYLCHPDDLIAFAGWRGTYGPDDTVSDADVETVEWLDALAAATLMGWDGE